MTEKSLLVARLLWLTCGWLGTHHLYLGRDRQAIVWFCTLGGFGVGWLLEAWRLADYVKLANALETAGRRGFNVDTPRPKLRWKRVLGEVTFSMFLGSLSLTAWPVEILNNYSHWCRLLVPIFVAFGVHTVANIGIEYCPFIVCVIGAAIPLPFIIGAAPNDLPGRVALSSLMSVVAANWCGRRWKQRVRYPPTCGRVVIVSVVCLAVLALLASTYHYKIYLQPAAAGKEQRLVLRTELKKIYGFVWAAVRDSVSSLYRQLFVFLAPVPRRTGGGTSGSGGGGWDGDSRQRQEKSQQNSDGRTNRPVTRSNYTDRDAYVILGLEPGASQTRITKVYRQLVKEYHPDKVKAANSWQAKAAESRFIQLQEAYDKLSSVKRKRADKQRTKRSDEL